MKYKFMNLQWFAEGDTGADGSGTATGADGSGASTGTQTDGQKAPAPEAKWTDEDVNKLLNQKFAEWQKKQEKKVTEAERLAKMTTEEQANERIRSMEERLAAYEKKDARTAMTNQARAILQSKNITVADELLENLIAEDAESTKASVESFATLFQSAVEKAVKDALKGETPKTGTSSGITKEQILKVANRAERQKLIQENMHLFT